MNRPTRTTGAILSKERRDWNEMQWNGIDEKWKEMK